MKLIDSHCHLDLAVFDPDRQEVLERARRWGIAGFVVPGILADGWDKLDAVCDAEADLHPAYGLHPVFLDRHEDGDIAALERRIAERRPVAVGEIGLDFYLRELDREQQLALFKAQLDVAQAAALPVLLHIRKAHDQVLSLLKKRKLPGGIAHAFNGSVQQAGQFIDLGFKLGFGGMLTYERSTKLRALAAALPAESLVLETDAPDMTVAAHHGERNSPEYLPDCLTALSRARQESPEQLAAITTRNVHNLLNLADI